MKYGLRGQINRSLISFSYIVRRVVQQRQLVLVFSQAVPKQTRCTSVGMRAAPRGRRAGPFEPPFVNHTGSEPVDGCDERMIGNIKKLQNMKIQKLQPLLKIHNVQNMKYVFYTYYKINL